MIATPENLADELDELAREIMRGFLGEKRASEVLRQKNARNVVENYRRAAQRVLAAGWTRQAPCVMTHTPPMDFAQCETHDETFPLGSKCRFDGRDMVEVLFEAVDEQLGRAVRAEMKLEHSTPNVYVTTAEDRAERAEAALDRVRALAARYHSRLPDGTSNGRAVNAHRIAADIYEALDHPEAT